MPIPAPYSSGAPATISGRTKLPGGDVPLTGTWFARIRSNTNAAIDDDGTVRAGIQAVTDLGDGATMTLPAGGYEFRFESLTVNPGTGNRVQTQWYAYDLDGDTNWGAVMETPFEVPVTVADVDLAREARIAAEAAAASVQREQPDGVAGLGSDGLIYENRLPTSASRRWDGAAPSLGIRTDTFFLGAGSSDQSASLAAFLADANLRGKKRIVGTANIANPVAVPAGTWLDGSRAVIQQTTTGKTTLNVTGDGVRIVGLRMVGPNVSATYRVDENAIQAVGASAAAPIRGLHLEDVQIERFGFYGFLAQHVHNISVLGSDFTAVGYAGIMLQSAIDGSIEGGVIDTAVGLVSTSNQSYGIAMTRTEATSLTLHPRTENISVTNVTVRNIPWEGIDTHGGRGLSITGNRVLGCTVGIAMVYCDGDVSGTPLYAPRDFTITGNTIDSLRTDGLAQQGISVAGAQGATSADPAVQYATGTITGNVIRDHGLQGNVNLGAIFARNTRGLVVSGNDIIQPSPHGIALFYDNRAVAVMGNTVSDAWSNDVSIPSAVASRSFNNTGRVVGNTLSTSSAQAGATYKNVHGFRENAIGGADFGTAANMAAFNFFSAAATPVAGI